MCVYDLSGLFFTEFLVLCVRGTTDLKLQLAATDYGNFLQNEPSPIPVTVIDDKLKDNLVVEFQHMRSHAVPPLTTFLDYIT